MGLATTTGGNFMSVNVERLLNRFLRYVQIESMANPATKEYPSSPGQWDVGRVLVEELRQMGAQDVELDEHGLVWATVPATIDGPTPVIAFNAHVDTSPETSGANVKPQVIRNYAGGDIVLPGDPSKVIRVAENPELNQLLGKTLVTTDGTTLLGADDKSGVAAIMEAANYLLEHPELRHGPIRVLFTCDEEIGRGVDHVDLKKLGARAAYTLDGAGADEIDVETFSADGAKITFQGINIHPSIAKNRMVNAVRMAGAFIDRLPRTSLAPECTSDREGFLHPYHLEGGVEKATLHVLLRDFRTEALSDYADLLRRTADEVEREFPGAKIDVDVRCQYRNLADGLPVEPRVVPLAEEAHRRLGRTPRRTIVRGGTDGSQLTSRGLPTPNLSTGEHNPHSPLEWTCLEEMAAAVDVIVQLAQVWGEVRD